MFECDDCGVMVVVPTRNGLCAECHRTYRHRGTGRLYVEGAAVAKSSVTPKRS